MLCTVPGQHDVPTCYGKEMPVASPGNDQAGYAITAIFSTGSLTLTAATLTALGGKAQGAVDCLLYDPHSGASANMTGYQRCVALIARDRLQDATLYEVRLHVEVAGEPWTRPWQFSAMGMPRARR